MPDLRPVFFVIGLMSAGLGIIMFIPMIVDLRHDALAWRAFGISGGIVTLFGALLATITYTPAPRLRARGAFVLTVFSWLTLSVLSALPFLFEPIGLSVTDALFEATSGITTTGATILTGLDDMPRGVLMWRAILQWIGGVGIIVTAMAILPMLNVGGMQLFRAEAPGPSADKFTPRVKETAKRLWLLYAGLTVVEAIALLPAMSPFDAINHAFATMATGGFSTKNGSVADFNSPYVEWVIIIFMFAAGVNFVLHYRMLRGRAVTVYKDEEFYLYSGVIATATLGILFATWEPTASLIYTDVASALTYADIGEAIRVSLFQVLAIVTTTGFGTADYIVWPPLATVIIFGLFFSGGMAGSTGGGVKIIRHLLLIKNTLKEFRLLVHPRAIVPLRLNGSVVSDEVMRNVLTFFVMYIAFIGVGTVIMALLGLDMMTALGGTISSIGNVGPAFGSLGPTDNYAHLPSLAKWILSLFMMVGRLEIFTVIVLLLPVFWKR